MKNVELPKITVTRFLEIYANVPKRLWPRLGPRQQFVGTNGLSYKVVNG